MVTLVGLRDLVRTLPAGTYRGTITRSDTKAVVAELVDEHQRKGPGTRILFRYGTGFS
jgi:hypothetical protein